MRTPRRPRSPDELTPAAARHCVLTLLAGRELTSSELRTRLLRRGFDPDVADATLRSLAEEGLVDDARAARARAHHEIVIKRHGRNRVLRQVQALGVDRDTAREAVRASFAEVDEDELLAQALARRLRGAPIPADLKARRRLEGWLLRQGFDAGKVTALLRRAARGESD